MTIEERFDRLTERHEALAQTVEVIAGMQRLNELRFTAVARNFEVVLDSLQRLERIAVAHERRLDDLENKQG